MSICSNYMRRYRTYSVKMAKYGFIRNIHSTKERVDKLIDSRACNDSLLQKIRIKFHMDSA